MEIVSFSVHPLIKKTNRMRMARIMGKGGFSYALFSDIIPH